MRLDTGQCGCMYPEAKSPHIFLYWKISYIYQEVLLSSNHVILLIY